ncbi:PDZ domain-containing protein [Nitrospira sp. MA-1]|nr:PDZ domain-containing protein [Nitrospira sp. MA-1]
MRIFLSILCLWFGLIALQAKTFGQLPNENMTEEKAMILAEQFGIDVGEVDEEIKKILGLTKAEGVVVYAVIGGSPAELSGIKVKAIIKEVDKYEIKTLVDLGTALEQTLPTKNFTVATYEPADPENQGVTGGLNFHFVRILQD